jgi:cytochrome c
MQLRNLFVPVMALAACVVAQAQAPTYANVGRAPTEQEIKAWDMAISREGKELPPGSGTAKQGAVIFAGRGCAFCHGPTATEGPAPRLVADKKTMEGGLREQAYATIIWDFINRAMPLRQEGLLTVDEIYALTAFLLYSNGIIQEDAVMDAQTLPKVEMPHRDKSPVPDISKYKPGSPMDRPFRTNP